MALTRVGGSQEGKFRSATATRRPSLDDDIAKTRVAVERISFSAGSILKTPLGRVFMNTQADSGVISLALNASGFSRKKAEGVLRFRSRTLMPFLVCLSGARASFGVLTSATMRPEFAAPALTAKFRRVATRVA